MASGTITYLGVVEVTPQQIVLTPEPQGHDDRTHILADLVALEAPHLYYPYVEGLAPSNPPYVLRYTAEGSFEQLLESDDEQERLLAREALAEGPYTGVQYVVGLTPIPGTDFSFPHLRLIAIRTGTTWRTPAGRPVEGGERAAAADTALAHIRVLRQSGPPWRNSFV